MSDLTEMWAALESYQPHADKVGHGESWKRMTTERTAEAAKSAADKAWAAGVDADGATWAAARDAAAAAWAAEAAARAAAKLGSAYRFAQRTIDTIKEAKP